MVMVKASTLCNLTPCCLPPSPFNSNSALLLQYVSHYLLLFAMETQWSFLLTQFTLLQFNSRLSKNFDSTLWHYFCFTVFAVIIFNSTLQTSLVQQSYKSYPFLLVNCLHQCNVILLCRLSFCTGCSQAPKYKTRGSNVECTFTFYFINWWWKLDMQTNTC